jgi:2-polyprenyl-3-methyl-5-hydroxy-6-metoxy-1,4-benzoquinol methylase
MKTFVTKAAHRLYDVLFLAPGGHGRPIAVGAWDRDYAAGSWSKLAETSELGHYALIVGYVSRLASKPRILDVGCGEGILRSYFDATTFTSYLGTDISEVAVQQALAKKFTKSNFLVADFETAEPPGAFDVVIFNESICYARDPDMVFRRYGNALPQRGMIVVSMHHTGLRTFAIWRTLERQRVSTYASRIVNEHGQIWDVRVFEKRSA